MHKGLTVEERVKLTTRERIDAINNECDGVWAESGVTSWERNFLQGIDGWGILSPKQSEILRRIELKVFYPDDDA